MLRIGLFFLVAPFALMEMLFYQHFGILLVAGLYFGLAMQADWAADRLLRRKPEPQADEARPTREEPVDAAEELRVHPLGSGARAERKREPEIALPSIAATPIRPGPARAPRMGEVRQLPSAPKFHGQAHEILGVNENAHTRTIVNAFRHWIKRFHPDRAAGLPASMANDRVQRLTTAKDMLLDRRRTRSKTA